MRFKTVRLIVIRNELKQIISTSGGLRLLQMVLELGTGRCVSEDARLRRGGWIVRSYIGWKGERSIPYEGVETSP